MNGAKGHTFLMMDSSLPGLPGHKDGHEDGDGDVAAELEDLQWISQFSVALLHLSNDQQVLQLKVSLPDQHVIWIMLTSRAPYLAMPAYSLILSKGLCHQRLLLVCDRGSVDTSWSMLWELSSPGTPPSGSTLATRIEQKP